MSNKFWVLQNITRFYTMVKPCYFGKCPLHHIIGKNLINSQKIIQFSCTILNWISFNLKLTQGFLQKLYFWRSCDSVMKKQKIYWANQLSEFWRWILTQISRAHKYEVHKLSNTHFSGRCRRNYLFSFWSKSILKFSSAL